MEYTTNLNLRKPQRGANADPGDVNDLNYNFDVLDEVVFDSSKKLIETTYTALKTLRDGGNLIPGQQYRITDFVTIINGDVTVSGTTKTLYRSANHPFDLIVTADSSNTLNENARAIQHSGDTYFASQNLKAWQLKYCLDNDTSRFNWANTSTGKGVIYYLKDERDNECGYDFKNIQMKRFKVTNVDFTSEDTMNALIKAKDSSYVDANTRYATEKAYYPTNYPYVGAMNPNDLTFYNSNIFTVSESDFKWMYTFHCETSTTSTDHSLTSRCHHNSIKGTLNNNVQYVVNATWSINNWHIENGCYGNTGIACSGTYDMGCNGILTGPNSRNIFGKNNTNIVIFGTGQGNIIGDSNSYLYFQNSASYNIIGNANLHFFVCFARSVVGNWNTSIQFYTGAHHIIGNNNSHIYMANGVQAILLLNGFSYLFINQNYSKIINTYGVSGTSSELKIPTNFASQVTVGDSYYTASYSTAGVISGITEYYKSHRGTIIAQDTVGVAPTSLSIGYTFETYETAS